MKALKHIMSTPVDWTLEKLRHSEFGRSLKNRLTPQQIQLIKRIVGLGKRQAMREVGQIKQRLYNLGFTKRGLSELQALYDQNYSPFLKRFAAWELMLWYANQQTRHGARQCLDFIPDAIDGEKDSQRLRKAAVVEAECLALLGDTAAAKHVIIQSLQSNRDADLFLAAANLETELSRRIAWVNRALRLYGLSELSVASSPRGTAYDRLSTSVGALVSGRQKTVDHQPKVSVIMPAFNAETVIRTSLASVLAQTWTNIEVLVVDDSSTDATAEIVKAFIEKDKRVRLLRIETNQGAYVARNLAFKEATGEFVTVNDADDWSHPQKIEKQARHLLQNTSVMANTSQQARATEDLRFCRRFNSNIYIQMNLSSLMFRRKPVLETIGYWDSVRFGADGEFKRRLEKVYGAGAVVDLPTGPLSFQRQTSVSLTGDSAFGYQGFKAGARREYAESHNYFHETAEDLRIDFPLKRRPFAVPEPMKPNRETNPANPRHFDVIIASDFRLPGGNTASNVEELKAQKQMGLRTGLIQMSRYDVRVDRIINPKIRQLLDEDNGDHLQMLVYGEKVSCDVLVVRHPPVLEEWQRYLPQVKAKRVNVIVNQPPIREYSKDGERLYSLERCVQHLKEYIGQPGVWYPIGPQVRKALYDHHAAELSAIQLADEDWVNIINVEEWRRPSRPQRSSKIRIGRHSRDHYVKWPTNRNDLLQAYPDDEDYEIHVLGGAESPKNVLGRLPANWHVIEFGKMHPKLFLSSLDVFVYYTHPDWIEAFGRVIFEAMAVGVPVIIPHSYRELFGEAAIYAEPAEVKEKIKQLMKSDDFYQSQVEKASGYVEAKFGYSKHASRLGLGERTS